MKRLLAFLCLLALGVVALRMAIGDDTFVRGGTTKNTNRPPSLDQLPITGGVPVEHGKVRATVSAAGLFEHTRRRAIPIGNGRERLEEVFVLRAKESFPLANGVQQLDQVSMLLFDHGKQVATLHADRAFVELKADANGDPSFDEAKDIDLRNMVLSGLPGTRLAGLRFEIGDAKVHVEDQELVVTTAPDQPVMLQFAGEQSVTLRGKGLQTRLPRDRDGAMQRADIDILHEPVLTTEGVTARARSRLHYTENLVSGAGQVTLSDDVEVELDSSTFVLPGASRTPSAKVAGSTKIRGDQFLGWLLRKTQRDDAGRERHEVQWRQLVLTGAPASIDLPEGRMTTPRLTAVPGLFGDPFLITAHGGESRLEQLQIRPGSRQKRDELVTGSARRRIHIVRPGQQSGAMHRAFGFPNWSLRPLNELHVVLTEGESNFTGGARTLQAEGGMHVARRDDADVSFVRGYGPVRVVRPATTPGEKDLVAVGNDGFTLTNTLTSEMLQLGPPMTTATTAAELQRHAFEVRYGDAVLSGRGACRAERAGEHMSLTCDAFEDSLVASMPSEGIELRNVHRLAAQFASDRVQALDVCGWPIALRLVHTGEALYAHSPRIVQSGPRSLRLLPADDAQPRWWSGLAAKDRIPVLDRAVAATDRDGAQTMQVRGPWIDVHHVGGRDAMVDAKAVGDERPQVYARISERPNSEPTTIAAAAERLRLLPFQITREARRLHLGGNGGVLHDLVSHSLGAPWLMVDRVHSFELDDETHGHVTGVGHRLFVSQGRHAVMFVGDPVTLTPARVERHKDGRVITLHGARVRMFDDADVPLQALAAFDDWTTLEPRFTLHEPGGTSLLSHLQATCRGDIEVRPRAIAFLGPVAAIGLKADGTPDPFGIQIDARELGLQRNIETGDIIGVLGKTVAIDWSRMSAACHQIEIDLPRNRCIASGGLDDDALVQLGNGLEVRAPRVEVDYDTLSLRGSGLRIRQNLAEAKK